MNKYLKTYIKYRGQNKWDDLQDYEYRLKQFNDKGWYKLPWESGWRNENGQEIGKWFEYWGNGNIFCEGNYIDGNKEGEWIFYYDNGKILKQGNYVNDKMEGEWIYYSRNGKPYSKGNYVNDQQDGKWTFYNKDGSVLRIDNHE